MVVDGHAWAFVRYSRDYVEAEREAAAVRAGIHGHTCEPVWRGRPSGDNSMFLCRCRLVLRPAVGRLRPRIRRPPRRAMDLPIDATATGWTAEPVIRPEVCRCPRRLIELDMVDLPAVRRTSPAEQESQRDRPAELESFTRPDVDVAGLAAGMRRMGGVALGDRRATKWSGGEASVSELLVGGVDLDIR